MTGGSIQYRRAAITCGVLTALLGLTVVLAWMLQIPRILQINPAFAPMQFNTAFCFLLAGISLVFYAYGRVGISRAFGVIILCFSAATLLQYILITDYGIDNLFVRSYITTKTSHPGRMAPNTALCFVLVGAVLTMGREHVSARLGFAAAVLLLSVTALAAYFSGTEGLYGWGNLTRMALHTALGMLVLGGGLLAVLFQRRKNRMDIWSFLPVSLAAAISITAFFSWYAAIEASEARNKAYFNALVMDVEDALKDRFTLYEQGLRAGLGLFYASDVVEREEWTNFVEALDVKNQLPGISGIGFIDYVLAQDLDRYVDWVRNDGLTDFSVHPQTFYPDKFVIRLIEPLEDNEEALGLDIGFEPHRRAAAERARDLGVSALTKKIELVQDSQKRPGFLLLVPVYKNDVMPNTIDKKRDAFKGWVYAPFIGRNFLNGLTGFARNQIDFVVYDGNKINKDAVIYKGRSEAASGWGARYTKLSQVRIAGRYWTIKWYTTSTFSPPADNTVALLLLIGGTIFSFFAYLIVNQLLRRNEIIDAEVKEQTSLIKEHAQQKEQLVYQLAKSNEDLERFAYIASHDLQEPLRMVRSFTGLLEEQYAEKLDETAQKYIGFAYSSAGRMQELIDDLLEYSRIGSEAERNEVMHMDDVYEDVLENLHERIDRAGAKVTSDDLPKIIGNPVRMNRLLQNLIGNALKYTKENETPEVHVSAEDKDNVWLISVSDNGIGIDAKYAKKIFEPFERLHGKSEYSGTGMGLAISKRIVEDFGGEIWIETDKKKVKQGAVFYFTIPK